MGTAPSISEFEFFGTVVYLGVECPQCGASHPCDAVCFRFSPRSFHCVGCNTYKKHRPMPALIREYQAGLLLKGITTT